MKDEAASASSKEDDTASKAQPSDQSAAAGKKTRSLSRMGGGSTSGDCLGQKIDDKDAPKRNDSEVNGAGDKEASDAEKEKKAADVPAAAVKKEADTGSPSSESKSSGKPEVDMADIQASGDELCEETIRKMAQVLTKEQLLSAALEVTDQLKKIKRTNKALVGRLQEQNVVLIDITKQRIEAERVMQTMASQLRSIRSMSGQMLSLVIPQIMPSTGQANVDDGRAQIFLRSVLGET